jgi:arylsulfatase A-like enzyme
MIVPEPYDRLIRPEDVPLPVNFCAPLDGKPREVRESKYVKPYADLDEHQWRRLIAHYYGFCSLVDTQVGKILRYLRIRGLDDNTIVVYLSDHGDMMSSHGMFQKGHPMHYEETTRVPMIIRHPDGGTAGRVEGFVSLMDVLPTLADLTDVVIDRSTDGLSAAGLLEDTRGEPIRDHVLAETFLVDGAPGGHGEHTDPATLDGESAAAILSIRTADHKLILHSHDQHELYDMRGDEAEMTNLASTRPAVVEDLRSRLLAAVRQDVPAVAAIMETRRPQ